MKTEAKIKNEERLLLELCRLEFNNERLKKIGSLTGIVHDWDYFRNLANVHGVASLAWYNLERYHLFSGIPEEVVLFLRGALMKSLSQNAFLSAAMGDVLRLFNNENIKTVLLKGLALENSAYGNIGLRQMTDVDILIDEEECVKARKILISSGYVSLPVKSIFHKPIMIYYGKHLPSLIKNGTSVDIHHELFGGKENELTGMLYDSCYEAEIKGERVWIPRPQIFFLYLVKHLCLHEMNNESQLRLYTDLIVLIEKHADEIINNDLLALASRAGMDEVLAMHLAPLRDFWGINFPGFIDDFIDKWYNTDAINKFIFFLSSPKDNPPVDKSVFYRKIIKDIPGLHRKFLYILGDLFPTISFMKNRYKCDSTLKVLFYYPHRMGKILWLFRPRRAVEKFLFNRKVH